jgi:hypothetical protein
LHATQAPTFVSHTGALAGHCALDVQEQVWLLTSQVEPGIPVHTVEFVPEHW